jgi:hypothetical protein
MPLGILEIVAQQEIFFETAALQESVAEAARMCRHYLSGALGLAIGVLRGSARQIDAGNTENPGYSSQADGDNLVGQSQMNGHLHSNSGTRLN